MYFSDQFIEILNALCDKFGIAVDWTSQNVIPYLQDLSTRLIEYEIITSVFNIMIALVIVMVLGLIFKYLLKKDEDSTGTFIAELLFGISVLFVVIVVPVESYDIMEASYLPEKVIIEQIQKVTNKD